MIFNVRFRPQPDSSPSEDPHILDCYQQQKARLSPCEQQSRYLVQMVIRRVLAGAQHVAGFDDRKGIVFPDHHVTAIRRVSRGRLIAPG